MQGQAFERVDPAQPRHHGVGPASHRPCDGGTRAEPRAIPRSSSSAESRSRRGRLLLGFADEPELLICAAYVLSLIVVAGVMIVMSAVMTGA
jgi:hypothetical protein